MAARWPWVERTFRFDFPVGKFPDVLVRFRGTPARVEELVRGIRAEVLTRREAPGTWSAQENVGHLLDLEALWDRRLTDFLNGAERLSPADIANPGTHAAGHNERELGEILRGFRDARGAMARRLRALGEEDWARESVHPRLGQRMRLVDAVVFVCEHDDYHLARVVELVGKRPE